MNYVDKLIIYVTRSMEEFSSNGENDNKIASVCGKLVWQTATKKAEVLQESLVDFVWNSDLISPEQSN